MTPPTQGEAPSQMADAEAALAEAEVEPVDFARNIAESDVSNAAPRLPEEDGPANPEPAPDAGKPESTPPQDSLSPRELPAPGEGQPAEGEVKPESEKPAEEPAEGDKPGEGEPTPEDAERLRRDKLGLSDVEPETIDSLREQKAASSKEAKTLRSTLTSVLDVLEDKGLTVAQLDDGTHGLIATEKFMSELSEESLPARYEDMPAEFRDRVTKEDFAEVGKQQIAALAAAHPQPTAEPEQVRLSTATLDECFSELGNAKLRNGEDRYAEILDPDIQNTMYDIYDDPAFAPFASAMNVSKEAMKIGLGLLHSRVAWAIAPAKAAEADAVAARKAEEEKHKTEPHPSAEAAAESAGQATGSETGDFARSIAYADA